MELKIEKEIIKNMLKDKVINPVLVERDQVLDLFMHIFDNNPRELKQLVYLLLAIDPVNNYQIGDTVRVDIKEIHSWNMGTNFEKANKNTPDLDDCIEGVISKVDPFSEQPYTVKFKYGYIDGKDEQAYKTFDQVYGESTFKDKKANAKPLLDL